MKENSVLLEADLFVQKVAGSGTVQYRILEYTQRSARVRVLASATVRVSYGSAFELPSFRAYYWTDQASMTAV